MKGLYRFLFLAFGVIATVAVFAQDPLAIVADIEQGKPVIIGWTHVDGNDVIPKLLFKAIEQSRLNSNRSVVVLVERPPDRPMKEEVWQLHERLKILGVQVIASDVPSHLDPPEGEDKMQWRDKNFANQISLHMSRTNSVVMLVGKAHLTGIKRNLDHLGIDAKFIHTWLDFSSLAVLSPWKILGFADDKAPSLQIFSYQHGIDHPAPSKTTIFMSKIIPALRGQISCKELLNGIDMREPKTDPKK